MRNFTHIELDLACGWDDEVGSSLVSAAKSAGTMQEQACEALMQRLDDAESCMSHITPYKSQASLIKSCKVE